MRLYTSSLSARGIGAGRDGLRTERSKKTKRAADEPPCAHFAFFRFSLTKSQLAALSSTASTNLGRAFR